MQLFYCPTIKDGTNFLDQEESHHCARVLRKKTGNLIQITDGLGKLYEAELTSIDSHKCTFDIRSVEFVEKPGYSIRIAIAPTKNTDRMEWFVEKAVEIGIDQIHFIKTEFSERKVINVERMRKKVISAMKQSERAYLPIISDVVKLERLLNSSTEEHKFLAHLENTKTPYLKEASTPGGDYLILIGPEGGFSLQEIQMIKNKGFHTIKIGDYRLRTETAGIVACTLLNDINQK